MAAFLRLLAAYFAVQQAPLQPSQVHRRSLDARASTITNLVTFGDSYTDVTDDVNGGTPWPIYAAGYGNFTLYPYARSGATCSNKLTPRALPDVLADEIPAYLSATSNGAALDPDTTVYTLWIGTNDLGQLLQGFQNPGVSVVEFSQCIIDWMTTLYGTGARNFIVQNMVPLQDIIMYQADSYPNRYYDAPRNTTEWHYFMEELTRGGNALTKYMLQDARSTVPEAHIGLFDSYGLFSDIIANPGNYLNGTAPFNVTGAVRSCIFGINEPGSDPGDCTIATGTDVDSFVWVDEVHPSEQSDRVVARELVAAILRKSSKWITWLS